MTQPSTLVRSKIDRPFFAVPSLVTARRLLMVSTFALYACAGQASRNRSALDAQAAGAVYVNKQYDDCAKLYTRAVENAEGRAKADYVYSAALCDLRNGRRSEAMEGFRRAMHIHPSYYDDIVTHKYVQQELAA